MKNFIVFTVFLFGCWQASGQDYLQLANDCFEKGDYDCAKRNYALYQTFEGVDMGVEIQKADECFRALIVANDYFNYKKYEEARDRYLIVLEKNPKDPYAKKQYNECEKMLNGIVSNNQIPPSHNPRHPAEPEMVFVQGGIFTMSGTRAKAPINISDFYIGIYEVTQEQWQMVMGTSIMQQLRKGNRIYGAGNNYPMYYVSWEDVQEFIRRLNKATGKQYRLPTGAEWGYAARGGNKNKGYKYSGSNRAKDVAWYTINSGGNVHPVGLLQPNEIGIYDMSGNVGEWCQEWKGSYVVVSGGGRSSKASQITVSSSYGYSTTSRYAHVGFRLALSP